MNDISRAALELFVMKAEKLAGMNFTKRVVEHGGIVQTRIGGGQPWHLGVSDEELEAFVLTLRLFIQKNETISFRAMAKLLDDPGLSVEWKDEFRNAQNTINVIREGHPTRFIVDGKPVSREEILQAFLYGDLAHTEPTKRQVFERWRRDPEIFGKAQFEFAILLVGILDQIFRVMSASKQELYRVKDEGSPKAEPGP